MQERVFKDIEHPCYTLTYTKSIHFQGKHGPKKSLMELGVVCSCGGQSGIMHNVIVQMLKAAPIN